MGAEHVLQMMTLTSWSAAVRRAIDESMAANPKQKAKK
jgi:hypothetical protein